MSVKLRPYTEYKDPGVPWLGRVPSDWDVVRLKHASDQIVCGATPASSAAENWDGDIVWATPADVGKSRWLRDSQRQITDAGLASCSARLVPRGSIILTCRAPIGGVALAAMPLCTSQGCKSIIPNASRLHSVFGFYLMGAMKHHLQSLGSGTTFPEISTDVLAGTEIPIPPLHMQRQIAAFLTRVDLTVRRLIRAKRRQIELLNEQKQVIINWAVTRGLNPNTPLKQSGIYWLDEIPAHWNLRKLKCLVDITSGQVDPRVEPYRRQVLVAPNHVESGTGRITYEETAADQGADSGKYLVQEGQIIYSKIRPNLRKAAVALRDCLCSADMYPLSPNELELRTEFLLTLLLSDPFTRYALDCSMRVAMPKINRDALRQCWLWYPSLSEQDEILRALSTEIAPLDTLVYAARRQIDLFREYRTRLIADVVTGKLDVRGVELPDLEGADIADDLGDSDFGSDTDQDDLPDAEEVEADDED